MTTPGTETDVPTKDGKQPVVEQRLHPVTPLRRAWAPVAVLIGWAVHDPNQAQRQLTRLTTTTLLLGLAVCLVGGALYGFLTWWFTHFAVTDNELRIRTGLLFRRTAHIRLERIQAVDITQPLLARVAGVAKLKLDVVGTDKKDELAYLGEGHARALRAELLARAAGFAPETAHEVGEAPSRQLLHIPARVLAVSLVLTGATWVSLAAALVVPPVLWFATHSLWTVLATGVPLLGAAGASSVGRFISEYDWTVGESPDGLRIDHGLLDRTHETVPPGRVQTVRIVEPLLWRRRGWVRVELDVAGSSNSVLVPVAPREIAEAVISQVLPGVTVPAALSRPPRRAGWCLPFWWRGYGHRRHRQRLRLPARAAAPQPGPRPARQGPERTAGAGALGALQGPRGRPRGHGGQQDGHSRSAGRPGGRGAAAGAGGALPDGTAGRAPDRWMA